MFSQPLTAASVMRGFAPDWFIAGGWAIDLFLGRETRPHADIEIAIFRRDQFALRAHLRNWQLKKVSGGILSEWKDDEFLELPVHEIHCFNEKEELPFLEILLNETGGEEWIFRRDRKITKPLSELYLTAASGIKFLRPEIVLLYKSKHPRAKDEQDFRKVKKYLGPESRKWLKNSLSVCCPEHHWLESLSDAV